MIQQRQFWTKRRCIGLGLTLGGTIAFIAAALFYAWHITDGWDGLQAMSFVTFAVIFGAVVFAVGGVMAIFIVMIIAKNEEADRH